MKKVFNWQVFLGLILVILSAVVYFIHYLIFRDTHHIFIYFIGDVGFVFIEVLLVTLILHQLLNYRDKRTKLYKLNMIIGAFFTEVGTDLLKLFSSFDPEASDTVKNLVISNNWSKKDFSKTCRSIQNQTYNIDSKRGNLEELKNLLTKKRDFLLNLLGNPGLLEHESFTDLLWAVFHITEELTQRVNINELPDTDYQHLSNDIKRAYCQLIIEWLNYMKHLNNDYPYLFSLAMRTNPFDANATAEIK